MDFAVRESADGLKLTFFGGEPLLRFDLMRSTVKYGREAATGAGKSISFHVVTNGTLLNDEIGDFIAVNRIGLEISIDGPAKVHDANRCYPDGSGSFREVYFNLCRFVDRHPDHRVSLFSVITSPESLPWLEALCRGIEAESLTANPCRLPSGVEQQSVGTRRVHAFPSTRPDSEKPAGNIRGPIIRSREERIQACNANPASGINPDGEVHEWIARFLYPALPSYCEAGINATIVTSSGQIFPCPLFVAHPEMVIGDIVDGFNKEKSRPFTERFREMAACKTCRAHAICESVCAFDSYEQNGSVHTREPEACLLVQDLAAHIEESILVHAAGQPEQLLEQTGRLPVRGAFGGLIRSSVVQPRGFVIRLTDQCNLDCDYCYEKRSVRGNAAMNLTTARSVVEYVLRSPVEDPTICLFGGEPLLNWDVGRFLIEEISKGGKALGKKPFFQITTNGTNITSEIAGTVARYNITVQVSIDGTIETHDRHRKFKGGQGTYDRIMKGIELLRAENPYARIDAQAVLTPGNTDLVSIAKHLTGIGFRRLSFLVRSWAEARGQGWSVEDIEELAHSRAEFFPFFLRSVQEGRPEVDMGFAGMVAAEPDCHNGFRECGSGEVYIDTSGSIYSCPQLFAAGFPPIGRCDGSGEVQLLQTTASIENDCMSCWAFERCRGGCMVQCGRCARIEASGTRERREAWCNLMRSQFARAIIAHDLLARGYPGCLEKMKSVFEQ